MSEQASAPPANGGDSRNGSHDDKPRGAEGRLGRAWREILRGLRGPRAGDELRETIDQIIETQDLPTEEISQHERVLLTNLLKFRTLTAEDVSVPRADIVAIEAGIELEELTAIFVAQQHSRLPVYRESLDDVIGMVHVKDMLPFLAKAKPFDLRSILRRVLFVAPSMRVLDLLLEMRRTRLHMALVVDEFGGVDGLVTIEDLVEEIVGDIADEYDDSPAAGAADPEQIQVLEAGRVLEIPARATVAEVNELLGTELPEDGDWETVAGLVIARCSHIPAVDETVVIEGVEFRVLVADERRIRRLRVTALGPQPAERAG